jgi:hypothetical protein
MTPPLAHHRPTRLALTMLLLIACPVVARAARPEVGPFTFCYGLERAGGFQAIADLGLNTLVLDLLPSDLLDLEPARKLIRVASDSHLQVIVGLPTCQAPSGKISPSDDQYTGTTREMMAYVMGQLGNEPGVTAWATGHYLEKFLSPTDRDLRRFLRARYETLDRCNAAWGMNYASWETLELAGAETLGRTQPFGIGRAAIDLADCQAWAFGQVMADWLAVIRALDPIRPVLTGKVSLYRSLISIPDGYDVVCVSMPPDVLEPDAVAHNVQALDIARRGGKFRVLQVLRPPEVSSSAYTAEVLRDWIRQAALHGSTGIALEDWEFARDAYALETRQRERSQRLIQALQATRRLPFDIAPQPTTAILYSPYAEGFEVSGQPIYGYRKGAMTGQPSDLAYALRLGTRYGLMDYLTPADLPDADLSRYGVILAPSALNLPPAAAERLAEYVRRGGALVGDLGLGVYQSGSWLALAPPWGDVFGVKQLTDLKERLGNLTVGAPLPALPSVTRGMVSGGTFTAGGTGDTGPATRNRRYTVGTWTAEATLVSSAVPLASMGVRFDKDRQPIFAGLLANPYGAGLAIFATHPLWMTWPLSDPLSLALHHDLFARRARVELVSDGLLAQGLSVAAGSDQIAVFNPAQRPAVAQLWAYNAHSHPYRGAVCQFVANPGAVNLPPGTALLALKVPGRELSAVRQVPLIVQPFVGDCMVQVRQYDREGVVVQVAGADANWQSSRGPELELSGAVINSVRLVLSSGVYAVPPGSRHQVTITARKGEPITRLVVANGQGELDLSGNYRLETVAVVPAG